MLDFAADIVALAGRKYPKDLVGPGQQVPLFVGPCFYCGRGFTPYLPCECPSCGTYLRRVVVRPHWTYWGKPALLVWVYWMFFRRRFRESLSDSMRMLLEVLIQSERAR